MLGNEADAMTDDLERYLESLQREDRYRVDAVLKESAFEVTQRVWFADGDDAGDGLGAGADVESARGPFIRKFINRDKGLGAVYERIYTAQKAGRTFAAWQ